MKIQLDQIEGLENFNPDIKANKDGSNIPSGTYWSNLTSNNSIKWNSQEFLNVELTSNLYYVMGFDTGDGKWKPTTLDVLGLQRHYNFGFLETINQHLSVGSNVYFGTGVFYGGITNKGSGVNTNSTKIYLENEFGTMWALSSGVNNVSETRFGIGTFVNGVFNCLVDIDDQSGHINTLQYGNSAQWIEGYFGRFRIQDDNNIPTIQSVANSGGKLIGASDVIQDQRAYGPFFTFGNEARSYKVDFNAQHLKNGILSLRVTGDGGIGDWFDFLHTGNFNPINYVTVNEVNNIYDQLSAKANTRLSNVVWNLSPSEQDTIKNKLGITDVSPILECVFIDISENHQVIYANSKSSVISITSNYIPLDMSIANDHDGHRMTIRLEPGTLAISINVYMKVKYPNGSTSDFFTFSAGTNSRVAQFIYHKDSETWYYINGFSSI